MASTFKSFEAEVAAAEAARQVAIASATGTDTTRRAAEKTYRAAIAVAGKNWGRVGLGQAVRDHGEDISTVTGGGGWKDAD